MHKLLLLALTASLLPFAAKPSSAAVTLKQNWQANQQLVYDTNIDGNLSLQLPANAPTMFAGIPLEINLRGVGKTTLDTLKVNDFGDGTVHAKINPLSLEAETFGQKASIKVNNGTATTILNGAPQNVPFIDWSLITNPPIALTLSPQMKVTGYESTKNATAATSTDSASPTGIIAMIQNLILQSLPAALPTKSLNVGDKWTSDVQFKTSPAPNATAIKLGSFDFELKEPQTMEGRSLQHIAVVGTLDLSSEQSKAFKTGFGTADANVNITEGKSSDTTKMLTDMLSNHLFSFGQTMDGDLYFDAAAGQFIQADLNVDSQLQTLPDLNEPSTPDGFLNFSGTIRFKLSK